MSSKFRRCLISILALLLSLKFCHSAPILFREFTLTDGNTIPFGEEPTSIPFAFNIIQSSTPVVYASWVQNYSTADVGKTFFAPLEVIADANTAPPTATSVLQTIGSHLDLPWQFTVPPNHYITVIERVLDEFELNGVGHGRWYFGFSHRVRILGERIPEPSTCLAAAICLAMIPVRMRWLQRCRTEN
jgi:hypothetical protein